ncbi:unnamed protein product [Allacma fusca]|uniref:Uncharacterized protein n=1 Tax=Allacma fusca TaxID=39272 RepID=A0A8J2KLX6_9HEXA|nr:unnamed protein product [Allacma fusca]
MVVHSGDDGLSFPIIAEIQTIEDFLLQWSSYSGTVWLIKLMRTERPVNEESATWIFLTNKIVLIVLLNVPQFPHTDGLKLWKAQTSGTVAMARKLNLTEEDQTKYIGGYPQPVEKFNFTLI